jgi:hypothetical protein
MDYQKASQYWVEKDSQSVKLDKAALQQEIVSYLSSHHTLALATADKTGYVRNTPLEYDYFKGCLYILSEGGKKFVGLAVNPKVSVAVFDPYQGFGKTYGMEIQGTCTIKEIEDPDYQDYLAFKKIPVATLEKLPSPLHCLIISVDEVDFLNSDFHTKYHVDSRQRYTMPRFSDHV